MTIGPIKNLKYVMSVKKYNSSNIKSLNTFKRKPKTSRSNDISLCFQWRHSEFKFLLPHLKMCHKKNSSKRQKKKKGSHLKVSLITASLLPHHNHLCVSPYAHQSHSQSHLPWPYTINHLVTLLSQKINLQFLLLNSSQIS